MAQTTTRFVCIHSCFHELVLSLFVGSITVEPQVHAEVALSFEKTGNVLNTCISFK